jgi:hypothetical protein
MVGERYVRSRNFRRPEYGTMAWWLLSLSQDGATAQGIEIIEVAEVVETETFGPLAIYRHWVIDPDGQPYKSQFAPDAAKTNFRSEKNLRRDLKKMGLELVHLSS